MYYAPPNVSFVASLTVGDQGFVWRQPRIASLRGVTFYYA